METNQGQKTHGEIIKALVAGPFKTLVKVKPIGALQVRKQSNGTATFYWRYSFGNYSERVAIGDYDASAPPKSLERTLKGFSVSAAINTAEALANEHKKSIKEGGRPAIVAAKAEAKREAEAAKVEAQQYTFEGLLNQYCDHLEGLGRKAHRDARSIFKLHVLEAWPKVATLPANQVNGEQVADMMRRVIELGKGRTANKLRSYVRAAYQTAKASRTKPSIPVAFKQFNVVSNPAADTEPDESQNNPDKNPLSLAELRKYWLTIKQLDGFKGALLRLHLLTGGQRIEQLVNLRTSNISVQTILIEDGKGRPGKPPRPHLIPLTDSALIALMECEPQGTYALSTDKGETHVSAATLSQWAMEAPHQIDGFLAKRLRSGVETALASAKVSKDDRGRLQSHGISGVQSRHYDGHDYMDEKRHALETLFRLLDSPDGGKVLQFRTA
jgi:integrase